MDIRSFVNRPKTEAILQMEMVADHLPWLKHMAKAQRLVEQHICVPLKKQNFKDKYDYDDHIDPIIDAVYKDLLKLSVEDQRHIRMWAVDRAEQDYRSQLTTWQEAFGAKSIVDPVCLKIAICYISDDMRDDLDSDCESECHCDETCNCDDDSDNECDCDCHGDKVQYWQGRVGESYWK